MVTDSKESGALRALTDWVSVPGVSVTLDYRTRDRDKWQCTWSDGHMMVVGRGDTPEVAIEQVEQGRLSALGEAVRRSMAAEFPDDSDSPAVTP